MSILGKRLMRSVIAGALAAGALLQPPAASAQTYTVVHSFGNRKDAFDPNGGLLQIGAKLYGTSMSGGAYGYGTIFEVNPQTGNEKVVYSFCAQTNCTDGQFPNGQLIEIGGTIYGTTSYGGTGPGSSCNEGCGDGTVFSFDPVTRTETVLYSFQNRPDGAFPFFGVINADGTLYGATNGGGLHRKGTIYSVDPTTGTETVFHSFAGGADGDSPFSPLIESNGILYGTTSLGGSGPCSSIGLLGCGTVFSFDPVGHTAAVAYSFQGGGDGIGPGGGLTGLAGTIYGTTSYGGTGAGTNCPTEYTGCGTVFSFDPATNAESVAYSFQGNADGTTPGGGMIVVGGLFYGTTIGGGANSNSGFCVYKGCGTLFSFDPSTAAETVLYAFCGQANCADGSTPAGGLIERRGLLYGTTANGGAYDEQRRPEFAGTVFSLQP